MVTGPADRWPGGLGSRCPARLSSSWTFCVWSREGCGAGGVWAGGARSHPAPGSARSMSRDDV